MSASPSYPGNGTSSRDLRLAVRLLLPVGLVAMLLLIYTNSLWNPFLIEANAGIVRNPDVVEPQGLVRLWSYGLSPDPNNAAALYRPITTLSYHLNARFLGLNPFSFRIVNILLLACLGWLAAVWIGRYTHRTVAWLAAAMLVAHPANTELINHIIGRGDLLSLIGVVGALFIQRRAMEADQWTWPRRLAAAFFLVLAVGAKETGLILLPAAAAQVWVFGRDGGRGRIKHPKLSGLVAGALVAAPVVALTLYACLIAGRPAETAASRMDITGNPLARLPMLQRIPSAFSLAWFYARQVVWPDTSYSHVPEPLPLWSSTTTILGVIVLAAAGVCLAAVLRRRGWLCVPLILAMGHYFAASNAISPIGTYAANRLTLPFTLAAVCVLAAWFSHLTKHSMRMRAVTVIPGAAVVAAMAWCVIQTNPLWSADLDRYWADYRAQPGNPTRTYNLGGALLSSGRTTEAIPLLQNVVDQRPGSAQARSRLAFAHINSGDLPRAAAQFREIIARDPDDWRTRVALAQVCLSSDRLDEALDQVAAAEVLAPDEISVLLCRARVCIARGDYDDALRVYESILMRTPAHGEARKGYDDLMDQMSRR